MIVACDCFKHCPLCGAEMKAYMPDLNPRTYGSEDCYEWILLARRAEMEIQLKLCMSAMTMNLPITAAS
jgi:hypothetical protein